MLFAAELCFLEYKLELADWFTLQRCSNTARKYFRTRIIPAWIKYINQQIKNKYNLIVSPSYMLADRVYMQCSMYDRAKLYLISPEFITAKYSESVPRMYKYDYAGYRIYYSANGHRYKELEANRATWNTGGFRFDGTTLYLMNWTN